MTLELNRLLVSVFGEDGEHGSPFSLKEITIKLSETYGEEFSYARVHRAYAGLAENPNTSDIVRPLPGDERQLEFSAMAARRIARRVVRGQVPHPHPAAAIPPRRRKRNPMHPTRKVPRA